MNLSTYLEKGFSYADYLRKIEDQLFDLNQAGDEKGYAKYYSINLKRMERLDSNFQLSEEQKNRLKTLHPNFKMLVISEGWCGDAAQSMPIVNVFCTELGVDQKIVFRDENPELMDAYLTDGAKSIPMFIGVDKDGNELFHYGPRPAAGMDLLKKHKENPEVYDADEFHKDLQVWYNQDKGESIFTELWETIQSAQK